MIGSEAVRELHRRAQAEFDRHVAAVPADAWHNPTPCEGWAVRDLVNHLVYENRWTPHLLAGETMDDVGDRYEGDLLGGDPLASWRDAAQAASDAVQQVPLERTVHLSFGDYPAGFYAWQLFTEHLVHAWDLARAIDVDERLDADLVTACADWFADYEGFYRDLGVTATRPPLPVDADQQTLLLAAFGRSV